MIRTFFLTTSVILSAAIIAPAASAHPEPAPAVKIDKKSVTKIEDIKLPTQAEIKQLQKNMPDMNAIMMKDPELREGMEKSGKTFAKKLEKSGAMEPTGPDGLPDFNKAFGAMLSLMGDEDAMGGMLESLGAMAEGLEGIEQHIPESAKAPKTD